MLRKVKGFGNLVKDLNTNAIINTDDDSLYNARSAKQNALAKIENEKRIELRLSILEDRLKELLQGNSA